MIRLWILVYKFVFLIYLVLINHHISEVIDDNNN